MRDCETIRLVAALQQGSFRGGRLLMALVLSLAVHAFILWLPASGEGAAVSARVLTVHLAAPRHTAAPPQAPQALNGEGERPLSTTNGQGAGSLPLAALPRYYTSDELDERPALLSAIDTDIPLPPGEAFSSAARFRLYLDATGGVDKVVVEQSDLPPEVLELLRQRFLAARCSPGRVGGNAVRSQVTLLLKVDG